MLCILIGNRQLIMKIHLKVHFLILASMLTTNYTSSAMTPIWCSLSVKSVLHSIFTQTQTVTPILLFYFSVWTHVAHFHTIHDIFVSCPGNDCPPTICFNFSNIILCPGTVCKRAVHKKKKPVALPVYVHCCSECLCVGVQNIHPSYDYVCCYLT